MKRSPWILLGLLPLLAFSEASAQDAGGVIVLSSTLLTVEAHERTVTVRASNDTAQPQRYRLSLGDMVMGSEGQLLVPDEEVPTPEPSASDWVMATPRSLALDPGESQTIRLLVRRPANLEDGEYRAHLRISQEPPPGTAGGLEEERPEDGLQFQLTTVYSLSIPVVIRQGKPEVSARLASAQLLDSNRLALTVERRGNAAFRGFVHAAAAAASVNFPITIYRERQEVDLTYGLKELADTGGPLTLTLYEGNVPRKGRSMPSEALGTLIVTR